MQGNQQFFIFVVRTLVVCVLFGGACYIARELAKPHAEFEQCCRNAISDDAENLYNAKQRIACQQTAMFVMEHMPAIAESVDRYVLFDQSLKAVGSTKGLYCEFGVAEGASINYIAQRIPCAIHGFDSFEGLPETWQPGLEKGTFATPKLPKVRDNVKLYKGWFEKSLPVWAKENPGSIAFMHLDADLYSSTKTVFDILGDRVVPGTILQFDEYFNYPGWQNGEFKAFKEFVKSRQVEFEYLGYARHQVAVRITKIGSRSGK